LKGHFSHFRVSSVLRESWFKSVKVHLGHFGIFFQNTREIFQKSCFPLGNNKRIQPKSGCQFELLCRLSPASKPTFTLIPGKIPTWQKGDLS
jgi:hypothetical protein